MVQNIFVELVESPIFTSVITKCVRDDDYRRFQSELVAKPDSGDLVPNSGGLRKARMNLAGAGKRGGGRVIYLYLRHANTIYLLLAYRKSKRDNLTQNQLKQLRDLAGQIKAVNRGE